LLALLRVLADSADAAIVGTALAEGLLRECAPTRVSGYFPDAAHEWLHERVTYGASAVEPNYERVSLMLDAPVTEVFRTGEARSWTIGEAVSRFPAVAGWVVHRPEQATDEVFVVPIRAAGRVAGVLLVLLPGATERTWRLRTLMDAAATALGVWYRGPAAPRSDEGRGRRPGALDVTPRQRRIVELVGEGRTNGQIAAELRVSVGTVKADLSRLYRMLAVAQRDALPHRLAALQPAER
jgi:DNA-binding CsgD family transcriptional regulator